MWPPCEPFSAAIVAIGAPNAAKDTFAAKKAVRKAHLRTLGFPRRA